ncbi:MAG: peptidoglycan-binding protein [Segetibacter sp.]
MQRQKKIKKGDSSLTVSAIKKRLQVTGEMPAGDTTQTFNDQLADAVKTFQISRGLTPDRHCNANADKRNECACS